MPDFGVVGGARHPFLDFNSVRVDGRKIQNDVFADVSRIVDQRFNEKPVKRRDVQRAIQRNDVVELRRISDFFFRSNGIYSRLCRYMAYLYRYDWFVTPVRRDEKVTNEKVVEGWYKSLLFLDACRLKQVLGDVALKVVKNGCYYGYIVRQNDAAFLQELPVSYCRCRYNLNGMPAVEFNVRYFDERIADANYRMRVLKVFPKDVQKAYVDYKKGRLEKDYQSDEAGWALMPPEDTVKFNLSNSDVPLFVNVVPALMDLDDAQDLDKQKMAQQLLRVIVQQLPMKKDGDSVFDFSEAAKIHSNAVNMLGNALGVNVLTTFADVQVADMSDKGNVSSVDQLDKVERTVYNEAGVSQMQFNSSGNIALEKSILNDEATLSSLILQFEEFGQRLLSPFNKNRKRLYYEFSILPTTIYNYKDLAKLYKEQTMLGFSLLLPQVAMGRSQLSVISTAVFEHQIVDLVSLFVPPQMSSTVSGNSTTQQAQTAKGTTGEPGRPALDDDKKSEKTLQNIESAS